MALFKDIYTPLLRQSTQVPSPDWRLAETGESAEAFALRCADALERHLEIHAAETAAFIIEPLVQGAAGMVMYHPTYLKRAREICDRYQVHLIADEIAVGMGRTGSMFACEQAGIKPDFICLSKGVTGGYLPLSVVLTSETVYQAFYDDRVARGFLHSHSYTGNALACRAALATLDIFQQDNVLAENQSKAARMTEAFAPIRTHATVQNFRHVGMIWAFEVETSDPSFGNKFYSEALARSLLLRPIGNTVYFMPPYIINDEQIQILSQETLALLSSL
jgi:adenosylmethionine-8-amino-7-oxononanoate aminotransferase